MVPTRGGRRTSLSPVAREDDSPSAPLLLVCGLLPMPSCSLARPDEETSFEARRRTMTPPPPHARTFRYATGVFTTDTTAARWWKPGGNQVCSTPGAQRTTGKLSSQPASARPAWFSSGSWWLAHRAPARAPTARGSNSSTAARVRPARTHLHRRNTSQQRFQHTLRIPHPLLRPVSQPGVLPSARALTPRLPVIVPRAAHGRLSSSRAQVGPWRW